MIPEGDFTLGSDSTLIVPPDDRVRDDHLRDSELGGVNVQDPTQGLQVQTWVGRVAGTTLTLNGEGNGAVFTRSVPPGVREFSFAFDQNMRPVLGLTIGTNVVVNYFDPNANSEAFLTFPGRSPFLLLDEKRPLPVLEGASDVLVFYLDGNSIFVRVQREAYAIPRLVGTCRGPRFYIRRVGQASDLSLHLELMGSDAIPV